MKVVILIRSYNRPNYLKKTLNSLFKSDLTNVNNIYIYDDNSNDIKTINILNNLKYKKNIKIIKGKKNYGVNKSYVYALKILKSKYKNNTLIITIDNDVIMKKNWINVLYKAYIKAKKYYKNNKLLLTGFNSSNAHINKYKNRFYSKNTLFYRKKSIGGVNFVFHISFINFIIDKWDKGADGGVIDNMIRLNYPILCLNKSVINHIGKNGTWSSPKKYNHDIYY